MIKTRTNQTITATKIGTKRVSAAWPTSDPPAWLLFSHLPVPRFAGLDGYKAEHPVVATLVAAIDGKVTLGELARLVVEKHGARPDAALAGTRALLSLVWQACR